jgi:hypothetical protein
MELYFSRSQEFNQEIAKREPNTQLKASLSDFVGEHGRKVHCTASFDASMDRKCEFGSIATYRVRLHNTWILRDDKKK